MPDRDPDEVFRGRFVEPPYFEDLTERSALKLTSLLRVTGRPHFGLWNERIGREGFLERSGQYIPIFLLDFEVLDVPIGLGETLTVDVEIRLAREDATEGRPRRLASEGRTRVLAGDPARGREVGRSRKLAIFAHLDSARGRVTRLHETLDMGEVPERTLRLPRLTDLLAPPAGWTGDSGWRQSDSSALVWSYQQTDPNRHVHAMEYPRVLDLFATQMLVREGRPASEWVISRAITFFARPCHSGEPYLRRAKLWRCEGKGADIVCAAVFKADERGQVTDEDRPAAVAWLFLRSPADAANGFLSGPALPW